jgi:hypothetical protein
MHTKDGHFPIRGETSEIKTIKKLGHPPWAGESDPRPVSAGSSAFAIFRQQPVRSPSVHLPYYVKTGLRPESCWNDCLTKRFSECVHSTIINSAQPVSGPQINRGGQLWLLTKHHRHRAFPSSPLFLRGIEWTASSYQHASAVP